MPAKKEKKLAGAELFIALSNACVGLKFISETDSPIEPFLSPKTEVYNRAYMIERTLSECAGDIDERSADTFFARLTQDREWHGPREREVVRRFRRLERLLTGNLNDLRLYRCGRTRVRIFILGWDEKGNAAGIKTWSVET